MMLADSEAEADFRQRLRAWLTREVPRQPAPAGLTDRHAFLVGWHRKLYAAGWVGLSWPTDYGGQGLSVVTEAIFNEELALSGGPPGPSLGYIGRPILEFGTEEQRARYLPTMLASDELWCQGFSEPEAGSDLASLRTRAVRTDGRFVVNGQKVWTSYAQFAQYCLLLARTRTEGVNHEGISALIVDMSSPGVTVRPLVQITGDEEFCEVFLDGVEVPEENLVGPLHGGWQIALTTLAYERGPIDIGFVGRLRVLLHELVDTLLNTGDPGPDVKCRLATTAVHLEALRLKCLRSITDRAHGKAPGPETSVDKLLLAGVEQDLLHCALEVLGPAALEPHAEWFDRYQYSRAATIYGGSAQIQRDIIAGRLLGLPRSR